MGQNEKNLEMKGRMSVSYTHLDVYKRQDYGMDVSNYVMAEFLQ